MRRFAYPGSQGILSTDRRWLLMEEVAERGAWRLILYSLLCVKLKLTLAMSTVMSWRERRSQYWGQSELRLGVPLV